jgi:hypothetical protein
MKKKSTQQTPQYGLCMDWETSGATWGGDSSKDYQGLSFGAIVFDAKTFEEVEKIYVEIKYNPKWKWSAEAEAIHGMSKEYLEENGISQEDAAIALAEFILKYWGPDSKVMFMGHNAEFDRRFTNQLLNEIEIEFSVEKQTQFTSWIQLHHVVLDTSPLGFVAVGLFKSDLLFEKMGFEQRGDHNALQDAEQTLATAKGIRDLVNIALEQL